MDFTGRSRRSTRFTAARRSGARSRRNLYETWRYLKTKTTSARRRLIPLFSLYVQGTIISIFNEDSTLGKKYVFDIRRTCREVYDNARRALYCEAATVSLPEEKEILQKQDCGDCEDPKCKVSRRIEDIDRIGITSDRRTRKATVSRCSIFRNLENV